MDLPMMGMLYNQLTPVKDVVLPKSGHEVTPTKFINADGVEVRAYFKPVCDTNYTALLAKITVLASALMRRFLGYNACADDRIVFDGCGLYIVNPLPTQSDLKSYNSSCYIITPRGVHYYNLAANRDAEVKTYTTLFEIKEGESPDIVDEKVKLLGKWRSLLNGRPFISQLSNDEVKEVERLTQQKHQYNIMGTASLGIPGYTPLNGDYEPTTEDLIRANIIAILVASYIFADDDVHPNNLGMWVHVILGLMLARIDADMAFYYLTHLIKGMRFTERSEWIQTSPLERFEPKAEHLSDFPIFACSTYWPSHKTPENYNLFKGFNIYLAVQELAANPSVKVFPKVGCDLIKVSDLSELRDPLEPNKFILKSETLVFLEKGGVRELCFFVLGKGFFKIPASSSSHYSDLINIELHHKRPALDSEIEAIASLIGRAPVKGEVKITCTQEQMYTAFLKFLLTCGDPVSLRSLLYEYFGDLPLDYSSLKDKECQDGFANHFKDLFTPESDKGSFVDFSLTFVRQRYEKIYNLVVKYYQGTDSNIKKVPVLSLSDFLSCRPEILKEVLIWAEEQNLLMNESWLRQENREREGAKAAGVKSLTNSLASMQVLSNYVGGQSLSPSDSFLTQSISPYSRSSSSSAFKPLENRVKMSSSSSMMPESEFQSIDSQVMQRRRNLDAYCHPPESRFNLDFMRRLYHKIYRDTNKKYLGLNLANLHQLIEGLSDYLSNGKGGFNCTIDHPLYQGLLELQKFEAELSQLEQWYYALPVVWKSTSTSLSLKESLKEAEVLDVGTDTQFYTRGLMLLSSYPAKLYQFLNGSTWAGDVKKFAESLQKTLSMLLFTAHLAGKNSLHFSRNLPEAQVIPLIQGKIDFKNPDIQKQMIRELFTLVDRLDSDELRSLINDALERYMASGYKIERVPEIKFFLQHGDKLARGGANQIAQILSVGGAEVNSFNTLLMFHLLNSIFNKGLDAVSTHLNLVFAAAKKTFEDKIFPLALYAEAAGAYAITDQRFTHIYTKSSLDLFYKMVYAWVDRIAPGGFERICKDSMATYESKDNQSLLSRAASWVVQTKPRANVLRRLIENRTDKKNSEILTEFFSVKDGGIDKLSLNYILLRDIVNFMKVNQFGLDKGSCFTQENWALFSTLPFNEPAYEKYKDYILSFLVEYADFYKMEQGKERGARQTPRLSSGIGVPCSEPLGIQSMRYNSAEALTPARTISSSSLPTYSSSMPSSSSMSSSLRFFPSDPIPLQPRASGRPEVAVWDPQDPFAVYSQSPPS